MVCLYVDDLIVTGDDTDEIRSVRDQLSRSPSLPPLCYIPALLVTGFWCGDRLRTLLQGKSLGIEHLIVISRYKAGLHLFPTFQLAAQCLALSSLQDKTPMRPCCLCLCLCVCFLLVKIEDEDKALILLSSLPYSYEHLVTTLLYGKDTIELEDVTATLLSDEIRKRPSGDESQADGLVVRGRTVEKGAEKKNRLRSKSKGRSNVTCNYCKKKGHIKKNCLKLKEKE